MRKSIASAFLAIILLAGAAVTLSACNTAAGFGQDMSAAGQAVTGSAQKAKGAM